MSDGEESEGGSDSECEDAGATMPADTKARREANQKDQKAQTEFYDMMKQLQCREPEQDPEGEKESPDLEEMDFVKAVHMGAAKKKPLQPEMDSDDLIACVSASAEHDACQTTSEPEVPILRGSCLCLSELWSVPEAGRAMEDDRVFGLLWRLLINLRVGDGKGADSALIKNHRATKKVSGKLNWHQTMTHICKTLNWKTGLPAKRISRAQAWKSLAMNTAKKFDVPSMMPEKMGSGMVVLIHSPVKPASWQVAVVMSTWHTAGKKQRPAHTSLPVDKVRTVRVACLQPHETEEEGVFFADSKSVCFTCSTLRIAMQFPVAWSKPSLERFQCKLTAEALQIAQRAHEIHWPKVLLDDDPMPCRTFRPTTASSPKKPTTRASPKASPKRKTPQNSALGSPKASQKKSKKSNPVRGEGCEEDKMEDEGDEGQDGTEGRRASTHRRVNLVACFVSFCIFCDLCDALFPLVAFAIQAAKRRNTRSRRSTQ